MKKIYILQLLVYASLFILPFNTFSDGLDDKGKRHYTPEEVRSLCGVPVDPDEMEEVLAKQDIMYAEYKKNKEKGVYKIATIPDWKSLMSPIENQGGCGNCWAHSATGVVEGLLHNLHGSNVGIDLDEIDIVNNNECGSSCAGGLPDCALI